MKKLVFSFILCGLVSFGLAEPFVWPNAWSADPEGAQMGGTFRHFDLSGSRTFNPFVSGESDGILDRTFRGIGLLTRDRISGEFLPYMAETFTVSDDGLVIDMTLRDELKWSDGAPITSADFMFFYTAATDPEVEYPQYDSFFINEELIRLEAPDDMSLRWTFPDPDRQALAVAAMTPAPDHVLGEIYREGGAEALKAAWGTETDLSETVWQGPWVPTVYSPDERYVFERNPHFGDWNVSEAGDPLPYLDGVVSTIASSDAVLNLYIAGEIDQPSAPDADDLAVIYSAIDNGDIDAVVYEQVAQQARTAFYVFNWNHADTPFKNELFRNSDFRRAMSHLTPRDALIDLVQGGEAVPGYTLITPAYDRWYSDDYPQYAYDPEAALSLLEGIGFTQKNEDGWLVDAEGNVLEFTFATLASNDDAVQTVQIISDAMREVGVKVEPQSLEFSLLVDQLLAEGEQRPFDAIYIFFGEPNRDWPYSDGILTCNGQFHMWNRSGDCGAQELLLDRLVKDGRSTLDDAEAQEIGHQILEVYGELQPVIYTTVSTFNYTWLDSLGGHYPLEIASALIGTRSLVLTYKK